LRPQLSLRT